MGFLKNLGTMLNELDKGIDKISNEIKNGPNQGTYQQTADNVNRVCSNCGANVPITAKFCTSCGTEYKGSQNAVQSIQVEREAQVLRPVFPDNICFYCGTVTEESASECPVCHSKLL